MLLSTAATDAAGALAPYTAPDVPAVVVDMTDPKDLLAAKNGPLAKIGTPLALTFAEYQEHSSADQDADFTASTPFMDVYDGLVVIDAVASGDVDALLADLELLGLVGQSTYGSYVSGRLPLEAVGDMAALDSLRSASAALRPWADDSHGQLVVSQGDEAMKADDARATFGVDGSGVTVGVISDSFDVLGGYADDIITGDLPAGINVLAPSKSGGCDEGRALTQLIHDVAPGADLAFHTGFGGLADMANGILELAADPAVGGAGADIIIDDLIYFTEPMFQDGIIAQAVDIVVDQGVSYFSSAGNTDRLGYESAFRGSGQPLTINGQRAGELHNFNPFGELDCLQEITIPVGDAIIVCFQWDSPFGAAATDMDLYLTDSTGDVLLWGGAMDNILTGEPVELIGFRNLGEYGTEFNLAISNFAGPDPGMMKYVIFTERDGVHINEYDMASGTIYGHANAAGAEAVGAAFYLDTPEFGRDPPVLESFSSAGPTPILFDVAGNRLGEPEIRQHPKIVAPDGTNTTFFGLDIPEDADTFPNFFGTSASAPHAAAVAALMLDLDPSLTPDRIYSILEDTALDMGAPGVDYDTGHGLIQADLALAAVADPTAPEVTVLGNAAFIADGDVAPDAADGTDFGTGGLGRLGPTRTYTVRNDGGGTLNLSHLAVTGPFRITEGLDPSLASGAEDTFTVQLDTGGEGTFTEEIRFTTNDTGENPFNFTITGIVTDVHDCRVTGTKWHDLNGDGARDAGEPGLAGATVYLDLNQNGRNDVDEPQTVTDADGRYSFVDLTPGTYTVTELLPAGYRQTFPDPAAASDPIFYYDMATGLMKVMTNGNYVTDIVLAGPEPETVLLGIGTPRINYRGGVVLWQGGVYFAGKLQAYDAANNGMSGEFALAEYPPGLNADDFGLSEWGALPVVGQRGEGGFTTVTTTLVPGTHRVGLQPGQSVTGLDFGNQELSEIHGTKWADSDGDGVRDPGESGLAGVTVYLDLNENNLDDVGEPRTVTEADGRYSFVDLAPGTYTVAEHVPAGYKQTFPDPAATSDPIYHYDVETGLMRVLANGNYVTDIVLAGPEPETVLLGIGAPLINDRGGTVLWQGGVYFAGKLQAYDAANNGMSGEFDLAQYLPGLNVDDFGLSQWGAVPVVGEAGEGGFTTVTTTVVPGTHRVRLQPGQSITGLDFGNQKMSEIHGTKWADLDGDGVRDAGESGLAGVTVYLDLNQNGRSDVGEPQTVTDSRGRYSFVGLAPGTYTVAELVPAGYRQTFPALAATSDPIYHYDMETGLMRVLANGNYVTDIVLAGPEPEAVLLGIGTPLINNRGGTVLWQGGVYFAGKLQAYDAANNGMSGEFDLARYLPGLDADDFGLSEWGAVPVVGESGEGGFTTVTTAVALGTHSVSLQPCQRVTDIDFGNWYTDNRPPMITSLSEADVPESQTFALTVTAIDEDLPAQTITYEITGGVDNAMFSIDAITGVLTFQVAPDFENPTDADMDNIYEVQVIANDGRGGTDSQNISVTVTDVYDDYGRIAGTTWQDLNGDGVRDAGESGVAGVTIYLDLNQNGRKDIREPQTVTDADGRYSFVDVLPGTYMVAELIPAGYVQTFPALATTSDPIFQYNRETGLMRVLANGNYVTDIVLAGPEPEAVVVGIGIPRVNDRGGTVLWLGGVYFAGKLQVFDAVCNGMSGEFDLAEYLPGLDAGDFGPVEWCAVPVVGRPGESGFTTVTTTLVLGAHSVSIQPRQSVTDIDFGNWRGHNRPPVITSLPAASAAENQTAALTVTATDEDLPAQMITYEITGGADNARFSIDAVTGELAFRTGPNFEDPTDADTDNIYEVHVTADDGHGRTDSQNISVTVTDVNDSPLIMSLPTAGVPENQTSALTVTATDEDLPAQTLAYEITGGADDAKFSIDATTGVLTFQVAPDYENPDDADMDNIYEVQVTANDGHGGTDSQDISVTATDVNDPPVITSDGTAGVPENQTSALTVTATDEDLPAQTITYKITGGADNAKFSVAAATGVLTFQVAPDFENPNDADMDNIYEVQVTANDGHGGTDSQDISVTATDVNDPPVITSDGTAGVPENQTSALTVTATDEDLPAQPITYEITGGADNAKFSIDATTGVLAFQAAPDFENPTDADTDNVYEVRVAANDGNSMTAAQSISVTVTDVDTLTWDGTNSADWTSAHWNPGPVACTSGEAMVVDSGTVTVSSDRTIEPGAAASLEIARNALGGTVDIEDAGKLLVTGDVNVGVGGRLNIDGVLTATSVNINEGGSLTTSGTSVAAATINGNVALADGATLVVDALAAGTDKLVVDGAVALGANTSLAIVLVGRNEFQAGTYTLIEADGGVSGTFASVTDLGAYVSVNGNGLTYDGVAGTVTLTLDKNLNPGDGNLDGATDVSDRIVLSTHNFTIGTTFLTGDYNGDGATDVSDRIVWNSHNFTIATASPAPQALPAAAPRGATGSGGPAPAQETISSDVQYASARAGMMVAARTVVLVQGAQEEQSRIAGHATPSAPTRVPSSRPAELLPVSEASPSTAESRDRARSMVTGILVAETASLELDLETELVTALGESLAAGGPRD